MAKEQNQQFMQERLRILRTLSNEELQRIAAGGGAAPQPTQAPVQQPTPVKPVQQPQQFAQAPQQAQQPIAAPVQQQVAQPPQGQRLAELDQLSDEELALIAGISPDELSDRKRRNQLGQASFSNPLLSAIGENVIEPALEAGKFVGEAGKSGLVQLGTSILQRGSEAGIVNPAVSSIAQKAGLELQKEAEERGPLFELTADIARTSPTLAFAPARIASGALGALQLAGTGGVVGALSEFFRPTPGETKEQSLNAAIDNAVQGAGVGAAFGGVLGGAVAGAAPALRGVTNVLLGAKKVAGKAIGKAAKVNRQASQDLLDSKVVSGLAQISDAPTVQFVDRFLADSPGGAGIMRGGLDNVLKKVTDIADTVGLSKAQSVQDTGLIIQQGGERFVNRFKDVSNKLYNKFDSLMPEGKKFDVSKTIRISDDIAQEFGDTPGLLTEVEGSAGFRRLKNFISDAKNSELDFKSIKRYRTLIGNELTKPHLLPSQDERLLRRMYGSLTDDMETAALSQGGEALNAFNRANSFYKSGAERIDNTLQKLANQNTPEQAFQFATSGTKIGGTRLNEIMKTLSPEEAEIVRGSVLHKIGGGEQFSPLTMLNKWRKDLSPEAKNALLPNKGETRGMSASMEKLSKFSERMKNTAQFTNTSKTAAHNHMGALLMTSIYSPLTAGATFAGTRFASNLMTSPKFVKWLASTATGRVTRPGDYIKAVRRLEKIAEKNTELATDISKYIILVKSALDSNLASK